MHAKLRQENAAKAKQWFDWAIEKDVLWEEKKFSQFTMLKECKRTAGSKRCVDLHRNSAYILGQRICYDTPVGTSVGGCIVITELKFLNSLWGLGTE